ncbi:hypothetical protein [Salisediminibacterium selenitireducens]|uniref:Uncharacterized protein n=1 Tax=Bacillus selenitireducens (strain ATCC 700615 / DSM 15326 / MLS10) TaxID=439292 RepID=D6Y039_BACIE|nr:hypothetical protein [Salisediminibacterium selenitireducens]ADI00541.1 hypothetical protein Bsel_3059 [[Bacillus] selenitireducens MLS10]
MTGPEPLLNVYPSETERNQFMLIGLVSDGGNSDEQVELREIDSEQGQERILQEAKADEYGYFYISGICLERFDFSRKNLSSILFTQAIERSSTEAHSTRLAYEQLISFHKEKIAYYQKLYYD